MRDHGMPPNLGVLGLSLVPNVGVLPGPGGLPDHRPG